MNCIIIIILISSTSYLSINLAMFSQTIMLFIPNSPEKPSYLTSRVKTTYNQVSINMNVQLNLQ